jgi:pimeloyl-ACP methyl ester carboxylesterase
MATIEVIALPGGVMPAAARYEAVASGVGAAAKLHTKDLEVYAADEPPSDYSIAQQVTALAAFADSLGLQRFHLLAYSGGGFIALAFAGSHPDRLKTLALFEFVQLQVREGVEVRPPQGPQPPWMQKRPAALATMMAAFGTHPFDRSSLRSCTFPVFLGYGDLTGAQEEIRAGILSRLFRDIHVKRFTGIHHFVRPEQVYTSEHIQALRDMWGRGEEAPRAVAS